MQGIISREIFIPLFFPVFLFPNQVLEGQMGLGARFVCQYPNTFQNIFDSGSSGSFKARMLTILLGPLNYDDLSIRKKRLWNDQRSHPKASLLRSFHFHLFKTTRRMLDSPPKGSPVIWVKIYETIGKFIILKITKTKTKAQEFSDPWSLDIFLYDKYIPF